MPRQVRASVEQQLADAQTEYRALETCAAAGQFNSSLAPLLGDKSVLMLDGPATMRSR